MMAGLLGGGGESQLEAIVSISGWCWVFPNQHHPVCVLLEDLYWNFPTARNTGIFEILRYFFTIVHPIIV
jgi:hypothetical protein